MMMHKGSALMWLRLVRVDCKRALGAHNIYSTIARCPSHVRPRNSGGEGVYLPWYSSLAWKKRRSRQPKACARRLRKLKQRLARLEARAAALHVRRRARFAWRGWTEEEIDRELAPWPRGDGPMADLKERAS
jgi:hypothetical protein